MRKYLEDFEGSSKRKKKIRPRKIEGTTKDTHLKTLSRWCRASTS
jgi:hypothetical protein